jgi:hypothetical protein
MHNRLMQQVGLLLETSPPLSRNQNFGLFAGREGQRVYRLYKLYLSLLSELEKAAHRPGVTVRAGQSPQGLELELVNPSLAYQRRCLIPPELSSHFEKALIRLGLTE